MAITFRGFLHYRKEKGHQLGGLSPHRGRCAVDRRGNHPNRSQIKQSMLAVTRLLLPQAHEQTMVWVSYFEGEADLANTFTRSISAKA